MFLIDSYETIIEEDTSVSTIETSTETDTVETEEDASSTADATAAEASSEDSSEDSAVLLTSTSETSTTYTIDDLYALIEVTNSKFDTLLSYNGTMVQDLGMFFGIWFIFTCWSMIKKFVGRLSTHGKGLDE